MNRRPYAPKLRSVRGVELNDSRLANMASATLASQAEVLDRIFTGLKDKNPDTRLQAAIDLQRYVRMLWTRSRMFPADAFQVSNAVPDMSSDVAAKLWEETVNKLSELVHSQTNVEKLGGILAIGARAMLFYLVLRAERRGRSRSSTGRRNGRQHRPQTKPLPVLQLCQVPPAQPRHQYHARGVQDPWSNSRDRWLCFR